MAEAIQGTGPLEAVARRMAGDVACDTSDPRALVEETRVLPVRTCDGVGVDVIFGLLPYEREAIDRAVTLEVRGEPVRLSTAEDLILHKVISTRPRDLDDAQEILRLRRDRLDHDYLAPWIRELSSALDDPAVIERHERWLEES